MSITPQKIGKYSHITLVAEGGMGAVYKAKHPTLQRDVIIKKLTLVGNRSFAERFKREARFMMDFRNENIVQVYDHFKEGTSYYIVMEYVNGITLESLIKRERYLPKQIAIMIFLVVCQALKHAHDHNILHRDIKPANILISKEGVVKLVDFGVSTSLEESEDDGLTQAGMTIGTPSYLAPEQIANAKNKDLRSDIYAMGVLLYEMLTGKKPFQGGFSPELVAKIEKGKYARARKVNPEIDWKLNRLINKSMHYKIQKRFQNLSQVIQKLQPYLRKKINSSDINTVIQNYINHPEQPIPGQNEKSSFRFIFTTMILIICLAIGGSGYFYVSGNYKTPLYQYILNQKFGAMKVNISLPVKYKHSNELYLRPTLFKEVAGKLERTGKLPFNFTLKKRYRDIKRMVLESDRLYLPIGKYTLVLYAENGQFRENFYLKSIKETTVKNVMQDQVIDFSSKISLAPQPLKFNFKAYDTESQKDLTQQVDVFVLSRKKWVNWQEYRSHKDFSKLFVSGKRYQFRFQLDNYYTEKYYTTIRPEQIEFNLTIKMTPKSGSLFIKSKESDIFLLINKSEKYYTGGQNKNLIKVPILTPKFQELILSPGKFRFSGKENGLFFTAKGVEKTVEIHSNEKVYLQIFKAQNALKFELIKNKEP